jgi:hypothetical protein
MKRFWSIAVVLLIALAVVGTVQAHGNSCNQTQTKYEYRTTYESTNECGGWCKLYQKLTLRRHQYQYGYQCRWSGWEPVGSWQTYHRYCNDLVCEPEPEPEPELTDEPLLVPTSIPDPHLGSDMIFNSDLVGSPTWLDRAATMFFVRTMNPVVGELGDSGEYVENTLCSIHVEPGQVINTYGQPCRQIAYGNRTIHWGVMVVFDDSPETQWFVPAINGNNNGWIGRVLTDDQNDDSPDNAYEIGNDIVCVLGCTN